MTMSFTTSALMRGVASPLPGKECPVPLIAYAGRVAASMLQAAGLPQLVANNAQDYEVLALALARDPARLHGLRAKLAGRTSSLFDTPRFARDIEALYERILA